MGYIILNQWARLPNHSALSPTDFGSDKPFCLRLLHQEIILFLLSHEFAFQKRNENVYEKCIENICCRVVYQHLQLCLRKSNFKLGKYSLFACKLGPIDSCIGLLIAKSSLFGQQTISGCLRAPYVETILGKPHISHFPPNHNTGYD